MSDKPRLLSSAAYATLKGATAAALQVATRSGSAEAFALLTRVEARTVRKYADHHDEMFVPLDVAADLDRAAGKPILAAALAQLAGGVVASIPADGEARLMSTIKETSEAVAAIASLNAVGGWDIQQAGAVRAEVNEALAALASLRAVLDARLNGGS